MNVGKEAATLDGWVRWELQCLWEDLEQAQRYAMDRVWSIACEDIAQRIVDATSLVGPVSWRNIGMTLIVNGWFERMNNRIGINNPDLPTSADLKETVNLMERYRTAGK